MAQMGAAMTATKRLFDILVSLLLLALLWPVLLGIAAVILIRDGRPVIFRSERMRTVDQPFFLWKFRTMRNDAADSGVTGKDKASRITRTGAYLRRKRLDELPQLWNILRGDISFVGPRPPLPRYVRLFPQLYAKVLTSRPGVTGLATLFYHEHEEALLAQCKTAEDTDRVYRQRCVPQKARLDLIYQSNRTLCLDMILMVKTVHRKLRLRRKRDARPSK